MFGGYIVTMIVIAIVCRDPFRPGTQFSVGSLLVSLSVEFIWSIIGGFVAAVIAQRREIEHAIGLVLFTLLVFMCLPSGHKDTTSVPSWYMIAGYISVVPATLLGGWLRMKQDILINRIPPGVIRTMGYFRFPVAVTVSVLTFVIGTYLGVLLGVAGLWAIERISGRKHLGDFLAPVCLIAPVFLSFLLSRCIYRRIMIRHTSLMNDGRQE